jgi:hypothetical protein
MAHSHGAGMVSLVAKQMAFSLINLLVAGRL